MQTAPIDLSPSPEDSIRIALDEMGRETVHSPPPEEDSALVPLRERIARRCRQTEREIARNSFPAE